MGTISVCAWQLEDRAEQRMSLGHAPESGSGRVRERGGGGDGWQPDGSCAASCLQTVLPVDASLTEAMTLRAKRASLCRDALLHSGTAGQNGAGPHTRIQDSPESFSFAPISVWRNLVQDVPVPQHRREPPAGSGADGGESPVSERSPTVGEAAAPGGHFQVEHTQDLLLLHKHAP